MLGVYTIVEASRYGWGSAHTLGFGALSLALLAGFVRAPGADANPLVPLRVFRSRTVTAANLIQVLMVAGLFGMFFLGALYLQRVLGYDAIEVGLAFLPVALGIAADVARVLGAADHALRRAADADSGAGAGRGRARSCSARAPVHASYVSRPAAGDGSDGDRCRSRVPVADDARDVRGHARGLRSGVGTGQHHPAGRRRARAGGARDARDDPHELPAWPRRRR